MNKIIAVDFDGTLCENKYPKIGRAHTEIIDYLNYRGNVCNDKLILWTCRSGQELKDAVDWCAEWGLYFDAINENLPETLKWMQPEARKIFANEYLDDRAVAAINSYKEFYNSLYNLE